MLVQKLYKDIRKFGNLYKNYMIIFCLLTIWFREIENSGCAMGFRYRYSRVLLSVKSRCKMSIARTTSKLSCKYWATHTDPTLFAFYTRSAARGQLQVPLLRCPGILIHTNTHAWPTRNHGLHTPYARAPVNRSGNNSYDYFYDPYEKGTVKLEAVILWPRWYSSLEWKLLFANFWK